MDQEQKLRLPHLRRMQLIQHEYYQRKKTLPQYPGETLQRLVAPFLMFQTSVCSSGQVVLKTLFPAHIRIPKHLVIFSNNFRSSRTPAWQKSNNVRLHCFRKQMAVQP